MTPKDWALMAQAAYIAVPNLGPEDSAGRIVFNATDAGLVLAAPGTNNGACARADAKFLPKDMGDFGKVHGGIWDAFDPVWPQVSTMHVYALVGHSEGATGVLFLGARLCLAGNPPKVIWAWEPACASIDTKLRDIFRAHGVELHIRRHGKDIVPELPLDIPEEDWQHPCLDSEIEQFGTAYFPFWNTHDHMLENIIPDL
jgi:hypothetical protein